MTACLNVFCASGPHEIAKLTSPGTFAASRPELACAPGWIGKAKRPAAIRSMEIRGPVIAITSLS